MKRIIFLLFGISLLPSCLLHNIPTIESYQGVPYREVKASENAESSVRNLKDLDELKVKRTFKTQRLNDFVKKSESNTFLIFQKGELIYEYYDEEFKANERHASFSIAKSIVSALVGIAIEEGKIKSDSDLVINYVAFLDTAEFKEVRIYNLLQMTSGIRYDEKTIFYSENSKEVLSEMKLSFPVGKRHEYWSTTYQLLGYVLQNAIAPQTISEYLTEKIWQPMGATTNAHWTIEKETEIEKTFCCLQATATDFGKFGQLYLNQGKIDGEQVVPKAWIEKSIAIYEREASSKKYNYGWWFFSDTANEYLARGFRGQFISINQEKETVIVRLGPDWNRILVGKWAKIFAEINKQL